MWIQLAQHRPRHLYSTWPNVIPAVREPLPQGAALCAASHSPVFGYWCGRPEHPAASLLISAARKIAFLGTALPLGDGKLLCLRRAGARKSAFLMMDTKSMLFCHHPEVSLVRSRLVWNSLLTALDSKQLGCSVPCSSPKGSKQAGTAQDTWVSSNLRVRLLNLLPSGLRSNEDAEALQESTPLLLGIIESFEWVKTFVITKSNCSVARKLEMLQIRASTAGVKAWQTDSPSQTLVLATTKPKTTPRWFRS